MDFPENRIQLEQLLDYDAIIRRAWNCLFDVHQAYDRLLAQDVYKTRKALGALVQDDHGLHAMVMVQGEVKSHTRGFTPVSTPFLTPVKKGIRGSNPVLQRSIYEL